MSKPLSRLLAREQVAFLTRDRAAWGEHLDRVRGFLGEGLRRAEPSRPVLILGAGSGLEVPWALAPPGTTGWDADPWSRVWTALRHRRVAPWIFEDLTGGLADLEATVGRAVAEPWSGRRRSPEDAVQRLAGLLPSLHPDASPLRAWIRARGPGTILAANVMGQFGVVAQRTVERAFGASPWNPDPERADPLAEAVEAWTARAIRAFLDALGDSGAGLWLVHDRAVVFGGGRLEVGPWAEAWAQQIRTEGPPLEVGDALAGVEVPGCFDRAPVRKERWLWPVAPGQRHLVEALAYGPGA